MGGGNKRSAAKNQIVAVPDAKPLAVAEPIQVEQQAPMIQLYNDRIRPLLDVVDKLRLLMVSKEGIQLPTIVVVGDQSSGKSSVLESLAGINLPRGQGICTRVPLIMRLQNHSSIEPELYLEYNGKRVNSDETHIAEAINLATDEIAGNVKGISNTPLTLVVRKNGAPDLTMVDLPGITRVPVHGQPENIYEQITGIIMEYINPEESIILNVLSATVDFPTCESIRMSRKVDKTGLRTLGVVTKVDKAPEGLLEKVTADDVNIGLGYVCVRNRVGDESYEEARSEEALLFASHPLLSKIDKCIVGIPVLAQKLVQIQANSIARNLPETVKKIDEKLKHNMSELSRMPKTMSSTADAMTAFIRIISLSKESLRKVLLRGEYDEYTEEDQKMHCTARLVEMLNRFFGELERCPASDHTKDFLKEEIKILGESKGIYLPNFLPRTAFLDVLRNKVASLSILPVNFIEEVWDYVEGVLINVLMRHSDNHPQLQFSLKRAGNTLIAKRKEGSVHRAREIVKMEGLTDYTCNPDYVCEWTKLMSNQQAFVSAVLEDEVNVFKLKGVGELSVGHLLKHPQLLPQAFDLKMRMIAYWKIVLRRLVDCMALHLQYCLQNLVDKDIEKEVVNEIMSPQGCGIERMLGESPIVAEKREKLNRSIKLLRESKDVVSKVMNKIAGYDY